MNSFVSICVLIDSNQFSFWRTNNLLLYKSDVRTTCAIMGNPILGSPRLSRNEVCYYGEPAAGIPEDKKKREEPDSGIHEDIKKGTRRWDPRRY